MRLPIVLAVLTGILVLACSSTAPAPAKPIPDINVAKAVEPTPDIDATVEARLAHERAVDATVEARLKEERASQATSIPSPTNTQAPRPGGWKHNAGGCWAFHALCWDSISMITL
jgi:hypothetical protein